MSVGELDAKLTLLKNKTKIKIAQLRHEYSKKLENELRGAFSTPNLGRMPILCVEEALGREYRGRDVKVISKTSKVKQKISLKIGDVNLSIGEYDSKEDGDLMEFLTDRYSKKSVKRSKENL